MGQTNEKIWVVIEMKKDGAVLASAYDNEADANNYSIEMQSRGNGETVKLCETALNRREDFIPSDDTAWGAMRLDIKSEFVEGLMEDMVSLDQIKPGAADRFVCERVNMVRRRTMDRIEEILKNETREELLTCKEDWCALHMED
jgi:hypothetical protein